VEPGENPVSLSVVLCMETIKTTIDFLWAKTEEKYANSV